MNKIIYKGFLPKIYPMGYLKERIKSIREKGLPKGYFTGVTNLDKIFRLDKQRLITVTGVPNCGKSEFVDFLVTVYNKLYGLKTLYYSPENQPVELHISKLISKYTNKSLGELSSDEIDTAVDYICKNFFFCNYDKIKTLDDIEKQVEHQSSSNQLDVLVIDAYNKIELEKGSNEIETEFISKILDRLCEMSIKYNIMVILVAHPRKMEWKSNDRVPQCPTAYDINGSANFYNKSDFVLAVHRDREEENETVTIRVDKVKFSHYGTQGKCYLRYDVDSGNYYNAPDLFDFDEKSEYKPIPFALPELPKKKEPLDVVVSLYSGSADNIGTDVCLKDFLLTDKYRNIVEQIRTGKTSEERKEIKSKLSHKIPSVTVSGRFSKRGKDYLLSSSGLMAIDIDLKDNKDIINQVPDILKTLPYVAYYGKSVSGDGYFAIIPIENPKHLKQHFFAIEEEMNSLGIVIDKACKDVTRLRYASYDENYFYNPNATTYYWEKDETVEGKKIDKDKVRKTDFIQTSTMSDKEMVERQLNYLRNNHLSIADDYDTWFKTGMALYSGFGENGRGYFHEFSKLSYKYDEAECNQQYDNIISHYDNNNDITLGTLIHIVNETKNKEIKKCA
ncbi:MAG: PriCT-2 domain-containing protein [Bacteroidales bacterium]|nr:PriCT-2 domain-containing protein [Bacteroidales bacterium]